MPIGLIGDSPLVRLHCPPPVPANLIVTGSHPTCLNQFNSCSLRASSLSMCIDEAGCSST